MLFHDEMVFYDSTVKKFTNKHYNFQQKSSLKFNNFFFMIHIDVAILIAVVILIDVAILIAVVILIAQSNPFPLKVLNFVI